MTWVLGRECFAISAELPTARIFPFATLLSSEFSPRRARAALKNYGRTIPDDEYQTKDFERVVALRARTEAIARHLTDFLKKSDRFAKTIVFCVDQDHANEMRGALARLNPDLMAQFPDYVCRVTADEGDIGRGHLSRFQDVETKTPAILTTSQLLTTGVDAPTCKNVVLARADLYWGAGDDAARIANRIHNPGRFVMLLPRELDMIAAGKNMPLPLPKPKIPEVEVRNENGRGNATFAKSKLDPRAATAYARASTGAHIDSKPSVSRSAARSVPLSKQTMRAGAFPHQVVPQISAGR